MLEKDGEDQLDRFSEKWRSIRQSQCGNEQPVHNVNKEAKWIAHILRTNCLLNLNTELKIEGRAEVTGRRGRKRKQILDDLKEIWGYRKLKEEALDRTLWRTRFGKVYEPLVRRTMKWWWLPAYFSRVISLRQVLWTWKFCVFLILVMLDLNTLWGG